MRKITQLIIYLLLISGISYAQDPPTVSGAFAVCSGSATTLTASGESGATFAWYDAETGGNLLSSTYQLNTGNLTSDIHFYVEQTTGAGTSARTDVLVSVAPVPSPLSPTNVTATPALICEGESSNLSATVDAANNQVVHWYDAASGGNLLGTSASGVDFSVSPTSTTTYYAQSQLTVSQTTFNYTGSVQTFTVPAGVNSIDIDAYGAQGGNSYSTDGPGLGGRVQATMNVTPGQVLNIYVGGAGQSYAGYGSQLLGGWNGGGNGHSGGQGGGGGGATDVRVGGTSLNDRALVAGGAGGKGPTCTLGNPFPHGGGLTGGAGEYCSGGSGELKRGLGGTQSAGGRPGCWYSGSSCGTWGSFGQGGTGGSVSGNGRSGGGGGGWYGGGGGTYHGDGGGGSSYTDPALVSNVTHTQGVQSGNGLLTISYALEDVDCASTTREPVTVTVEPVPTVVADADTYNCPGNGVNISASGATTYSWEPGSLTGASITVDPAVTTTYTVTGTTGNCSETDEITVTVSDVVASGDVSICNGNNTTLTASGAVTYTWEPGALSGSSVVVSPSITTTYTVTGHDPSGCTTTDDVVVTVNPVPTVTASNDTLISNGNTATLVASGADTYSWSPGSLSGASVTVTPSSTTTYTVTGYFNGTGCSDTEDVVVSVVDIPTITGTMTILANQTTTLTASGPGSPTFAWYDAETGGNLLSPTAAFTTSPLTQNSTFYVELNDGVNTSTRVPVNITAIDSTLSGVGAADPTICPGASTDLGAALPSPGVINWYDAPSGGNFIGSSESGVGFPVSPSATQTYYAEGETQEKTVTYNYTGSMQTFTVPAGVTSIDIDAYGAQGGDSYSTGGPGLGGRVQATMNVTPGQVLNIYVGGAGQSYAGYGSQLLGGWNGGGNGHFGGQGGGGGGATDIRLSGTSLNDRVLVAGGAGGKGPTCTLGNPFPHGGGLTGGAGEYCSGGSGELKRGLGGTQTGGGRPGCWYSGSSCGTWGSLGQGGTGGSVSGNGRSGGGGGGWYGGGGGTYHGDGGGGSSYTLPGLHNVVHTQGVRSGNGVLIINYSKNSTNSTLVPATVTVEDVTAPVPDVTNLPNAQGDAPLTVNAPFATDECTGAIEATTTDPTTYYTQGTYTITWNYDDGNGNISNQDQTVIVNTTLPVELSRFGGKCQGNMIVLDWTTESEINSSHFQVLRSPDGVTWESMGSVPSVGNSRVANDYEFREESRFGYDLYCLKQVDLDGKSSRSDVISIDCGAEEVEVNIYPNPTNDVFTVSILGQPGSELQISLIDNLGQLLEKRSINFSQGWEKTTFSLANYPAGFYKIQVDDMGKTSSYRIVKIRE